jgi:hypothetical protein
MKSSTKLSPKIFLENKVIESMTVLMNLATIEFDHYKVGLIYLSCPEIFVSLIKGGCRLFFLKKKIKNS